jgi:hypothetical protein
MADNTNEEHLDNPINNISENPPDEITLPVDTETINPNQETENMEVHHHAHHEGKKNWKSYFWEFLMLFLAVFCGFLAEYQLEHKIESDRAKELANSFYQELKRDSVTAGVKVQNRLKQEAALKYMIKYFRDSALTNVPKEFALNFEYGISFRSPSLFEPRTTMLEQLRNAGSLRYFKNEELQYLTGELTVAIKNVYDRQELEDKTRMEYITPLIIQYYDYEFDTDMKKDDKTVFEGVMNYEKSNEIIPYHLNESDKIDRKRIVSILSYFLGNNLTSTRQTHIKKYIEVNANLLKILRNDYHLN